MRKARDAFTKAMGRGGLGRAFTLRETGNSWRVLSRGVRSSDLDHKGSALVVMLRTHYRRRVGPVRNYFSSSGGGQECLDSGCILKVEPTESLVGSDTGCERKMS